MATLAELAATTREDLIPGMTLSPFRLPDFGEMERRYYESHLAAVRAAAGDDVVLREKFLKECIDRHERGEFQFGTAGFRIWTLSPSAIPTLLYLSLKHKHGDVTLDKASALLREDQERSERIIACLWDFLGYGSKKEVSGTAESPPEKSTGPESTTSSEPTSPASAAA